MMNLYREEEGFVKRKGALRLAVQNALEVIGIFFTSIPEAIGRGAKVKKVEKGVETMDFKDTDGLKKIYELINDNELDDPRYGKAVSKETMQKFVDLVEKNGGEIVPDYHMKYYKDIASGLYDKLDKEMQEIVEQGNRKNEEYESRADYFNNYM